MLHHELRIETEPRCLSLWQQSWARRFARVTLLVDLGEQIVIIRDPLNGFWFLRGGGMEQEESVEETAKREALEELGIETKVNRVIASFHVTLASDKTGQEIEIHPFVALHVTQVGGQLKSEYAPNRKIVLIGKDECRSLLQDFEIPKEYECMKPYFYISREIIREVS